MTGDIKASAGKYKAGGSVPVVLGIIVLILMIPVVILA